MTRMVPAASRLTMMVLSCASPLTVKTLSAAENVAVTAGRTRRSSSLRPVSSTRGTRRDGRRRPGRLGYPIAQGLLPREQGFSPIAVVRSEQSPYQDGGPQLVHSPGAHFTLLGRL